MARGKFIVLCGGEGTGKTRILFEIQKYGRLSPHDVLLTREPGGTPAAEAFRKAVLNPEFSLSPFEQLLGVEASRSHHVRNVVIPATEYGQHVLCSRFREATYAYQVSGAPESINQLFHRLEEFSCHGVRPDLFIFLDVDPKVGMARKRGQIAENGEALDVFELKDIEFHEGVRAATKRYLVGHPHVIVDASQSFEEVLADVIRIIRKQLDPG